MSFFVELGLSLVSCVLSRLRFSREWPLRDENSHETLWDQVSWDLMTKSHETACWDRSKPPKTLFGRLCWRSECTGRPHWLTRSFWGLVHCIVVFCLLWRWRRNVRPLYNIVRYSLLLCFSLGVCTPYWARARIFPPYYVLKRPSP